MRWGISPKFSEFPSSEITGPIIIFFAQGTSFPRDLEISKV